jgi:TetR/AcrR family transcriptional regulator, regulator of mycofactocin system
MLSNAANRSVPATLDRHRRLATIDAVTLATTLMEQRKQGAIDQIAMAALELFARDGFATTSVEAIAAAAGCSPRTFYRYFATKEDVMFHDLPAVLEQLRQRLDTYLNHGLGPWAAVTQAFVDYVDPFDATDPELPTQRLNLWLNEPALRARFTHYISEAEHVIAGCLHRHRRTTPEADDLPQIIAVAATGAYRVTILTHTGTHRGQKLTKHLRDALAMLGSGLADVASTAPARVPGTRARQ